MKALVTGGAGFIASHLADYLIDEGHQVFIVDNLVSGRLRNINPKAIFHSCDIRESGSLTAVFRLVNPDFVFHLAAVSRTPWAIKEPIYTYETNVVGSANVLEAARKVGVKKVVLASSNIVYAAPTAYKFSKLAMESVARDYDINYGIETLCLRFSNVYGKVGDTPIRQHPDNVLMALSESKRRHGYITIFGDGSKIIRNFTHVSDIVRGLVMAAESPVHCDEIDLTHPREWTLDEVAYMYGCEVRNTEERKGDVEHLQMQGPSRAKELLGWEATRNLEDNISVYTDV